MATPPTDIDPEPIIDFRSGYVQRVIEDLPRQGRRSPWRTHQNYIKDMLTIRYSGLTDGHLSFSRSR